MPKSEIVAYTYTEIQRATGLDIYHVSASATAAEREDRCLDEATSYGFLSSFELCESRKVMVYNHRSIRISLVQMLKFSIMMIDLGRLRKDPANERSPMISYT